ncbi:hypothetical protein QOZ80_6BG0469620 [Eleusine coracana subsp. coracana]|nr:hypothetical protein QOZ80_6BG0469620 [Eleusine coracana subsp. coracana]
MTASGGVSFPAAASCILLLVVALASSSAWATPQVFVVGGEPRGWRKPEPNDETYNHWAARNRFHIGDFLQFKYEKNDSVLVISRDDYKLCGAARPMQHFEGGDTRFRLDRSGFFYFLSGAPGHCDAGQRLATRVMAKQEATPPARAPAAAAMSPGSDDDEDEGGYISETKPTPGAASGSVSIPRTPPPHNSTDSAAGVRAPSAFAGCHVVGTILSFVLMCLAP